MIKNHITISKEEKLGKNILLYSFGEEPKILYIPDVLRSQIYFLLPNS